MTKICPHNKFSKNNIFEGEKSGKKNNFLISVNISPHTKKNRIIARTKSSSNQSITSLSVSFN